MGVGGCCVVGVVAYPHPLVLAGETRWWWWWWFCALPQVDSAGGGQ